VDRVSRVVSLSKNRVPNLPVLGTHMRSFNHSVPWSSRRQSAALPLSTWRFTS
jgi:hypothetical protein